MNSYFFSKITTVNEINKTKCVNIFQKSFMEFKQMLSKFSVKILERVSFINF